MRTFDRRAFVAGTAGVTGTLATALLAGCDQPAAERRPRGGGRKPAEGAGSTKGPTAKEAPALAEQVSSGALPALKDRLPDTPLRVKPFDGTGKYGGTWHTAIVGKADTAWLGRVLLGADRIVSWDFDWEKIQPNIADSFEVSADATEYTFHLRPGMKWSDGKPLTADDIMFWYDDVFSNKDLTPDTAGYLAAKGKPVTVTKGDAQTVTFTYAGASGLLLQWLASYDEAFRLLPRHYLEQFHVKYNPDAGTLAKKEGLDTWVDLFFAKADMWANPDLPRVHAWVPSNALGKGNRLLCKRNPYYHKVDPNGSQLPYLDEVSFNVVSNEQTLVLQASNGDLDMHERNINTPQNKPVLARNREPGNYDFFELKNSYLNVMTIHLNLTHKDPVKREIFRNKDFRIGLSHAINRQEIINAVYQRQGVPWQIAPRPETPFADKEMGTQYTEYSPKLANRFLDRAGYTQRNSAGLRLGPDGNPISFSILSQTRYFEMIDALQLMRRYWRSVGIDMQPKNIDGTLWTEQVDANEHDGAVDDGSPGYKDMVLDPRWVLTADTGGNRYAPLWNNWYSGSQPNEEPPEPMRREIEIYRNEVLTEPDQDRQFAAMHKIIEIAKKEFWIMGIALPGRGYGIVRNDFHNVPKLMWEAARYPTPGPSNPCQYYTTRT